MDKNDSLILKTLCAMEIPKEYFLTFDREVYISAIIGYSQQLLNKDNLKKEEMNDFKIAQENFKKDACKFVGNTYESLIYYNIMKACLIIFDKYMT